MGLTPEKIYSVKKYGKYITHCVNCGKPLVDGDRVVIRKEFNATQRELKAKRKRFIDTRDKRRGDPRSGRAYHVDTCYYAEGIATK